MAPTGSAIKTYSGRNTLNLLLMSNLVKRKQSQRGKKRKGVIIKDLPLPDKNHHLLDDSFKPHVKTDDPFDLVCRLSDNSILPNVEKGEVKSSDSLSLSKNLSSGCDYTKNERKRSRRNEMKNNKSLNKTDDNGVKKLLVASTPKRGADLVVEAYQDICSWNYHPDITPKDFDTTPIRKLTKSKLNSTNTLSSKCSVKNNSLATVYLLCSNDPLRSDDYKLRAKPKVALCDMMDRIGISNAVTCPLNFKGFSKEDQNLAHQRVQMLNKIENGFLSSIRYHDRNQKRSSLRIKTLKKTVRTYIKRNNKSKNSLGECQVRKIINFVESDLQGTSTAQSDHNDTSNCGNKELVFQDHSYSRVNCGNKELVFQDHSYSRPEDTSCRKDTSLDSAKSLWSHSAIDNTEFLNDLLDESSSKKGEEAGLPEVTADVSSLDASSHLEKDYSEVGNTMFVYEFEDSLSEGDQKRCKEIEKFLFDDKFGSDLNGEDFSLNKVDKTQVDDEIPRKNNINGESWIENSDCENENFEPTLYHTPMHSRPVQKDDVIDLIDCAHDSIYHDHSYAAKIGVDKSNCPVLQYSSQENVNDIIEDTYDEEDFAHSIQPEMINSDDCVIVPEESNKTVLVEKDPLKLDSDPLLVGEIERNQEKTELFDDNNDLSIVIDDASEELPFLVTETCYDDPVTIIYNGTETSKELTIEDIQEMDLNVIKHGEFSCITGKFGKPANKEYFCPICENFKTKRVIEFTQHLYKDLEYDRFVCTRCGLSNTSSKVLERHSIKKHPNAALLFIPLLADTRIEDYVKKLLAYQQRVMFAASQPEIVERKLEPNAYGEFKNPEKCKHCSYTSKYCGDLKKHETRHWAVKPYKCGICAFEGVTSSEVEQHSRRVHANRTPDVITVKLPENPVIVPISRKRRYTTKVDSDVSSDAFEFTDNSSNAPLLDNSDGMDHENDEMMYVCHYCPKRGTNESEIKDHWEIIHKPKSMIFKVKKVKRSDLVKTPNVVTYKCGYCDFKAQFDNVHKYCKELHPEMTFSAFRFKCGVKECKEYLMSYDHVKTHFNASHPNVEVSYIDVSEVTTVAAPKINCEFCSLKFDSRDKFTLHQKEMHSYLLPIFPTPEVPLQSPTGVEVNQYKCPECNHISCNYAAMRKHVRIHAKPFICSYCMQRFLYPSVVKTHHNREHRDLEFKYECDDVAIKRNDYLRSNILILSKDGTYVKNKTSKILKRNLPSSTEVNPRGRGISTTTCQEI